MNISRRIASFRDKQTNKRGSEFIFELVARLGFMLFSHPAVNFATVGAKCDLYGLPDGPPQPPPCERSPRNNRIRNLQLPLFFGTGAAENTAAPYYYLYKGVILLSNEAYNESVAKQLALTQTK